MEVRESIARASATAGGAVLFAGGTVAISLLALVVAGIPLVTTLGYTSAIAVVFAILAALTLLPALFALLGSHVSAIQLPWARNRAAEVQSPLWTRLATWISNHRWPVMIAVLAVLLALAIPTLVDAPGPGGRRGGADRHDRSPVLRPDHKGLRGGDERAVPDLRPPEQAREAGPEEPQHDQSGREAAATAAAADRAAGAPGGRDPAAGAGRGEAADAEPVQRARQQEEAGRAAGDRPAPSDPANGPPEDQGRQVGDAAARQQEGDRGGLHADSQDVAVRPQDRGPGLAPEGLDDPEGDQGPGHDGLRRRHDSRVCRPRRQDHQQAASGHPGRRGAQLPGAPRRVPLARAARPRQP